ncbi:MAG: zf-TFIIB domain-containing protein [Candidatus Gastranaerophilales bacterium]|nr:zf-TFIIB domain-containing protein [Candidatus Gastranaerophilales bacterium]MCM1072971.1 zf-TFIIB domain-containing protein [Bacteroides sp.]
MADTKIHLECPACGKEMTKLYMAEAGVNIDICLDGCGGIYFDNRELEKFDESHEKIDEILNAIEGRHFEPVEDKEVRLCPVCEVQMSKMGAANGEVQIDVCNHCGGKFLDNGELLKIREAEAKTNSKTEELLTVMYEENLRDVAGNNSQGFAGREKRRGFFEDLAKRYFM